MASKRKGSKGPLSGRSKYPHPEQMKTIGGEIERIADVKWVPAEDADAFARRHNGTVVDDEIARDFLHREGYRPGYVAVAAAPRINAETLTHHEEMIDEALGFARGKGSKDDPVFRRLNQTIKDMRDNFPYYIDEEGNLIDPPSGATPGGGAPGGGAPPNNTTAVTLNDVASSAPDPTTMVNVDDVIDQEASVRPSTEADTIPRQSEGEAELGSEDFIPTTEELTSNDFMPPSEVELGSADFDPETVLPAEGKPTPRLRDLRRRAVPNGPQKAEYPTYKEYLMARARWRLKEGKATKADLARIKNHAKDSPPTQRSPETQIPNTKRSVAPEEETPLSLLAGNKLAMPHEGERLLERLQYPSFPVGERYQEFAKQLSFLKDAPKLDGNVRREIEDLAANLDMSSKEYDHVQDILYPPDAPRRGDPILEALRNQHMEPPVRPDESLPAPNGDQWQNATDEGKEWFDDIVSPSREPRSDEAKRLGDLTEQTQAFEHANAQVQNVEERLGKLEKDARVKSILGIMKEKLGRDVTIEDLIRAGLMGGGVASMLSDDENVQKGGMIAGILGGPGLGKGAGKGAARELEALLANGETRKGFSALRHKQSEALQELTNLKNATGADRDEAIIGRLIRYGQGENIVGDQALLKVAKELGIEKELRNIAALAVYPKLKNKARLGLGTQHFFSPTNFVGHRADRALQLASGQRNPFAPGPLSMTERFFDITGGRVGSRFGNNIEDLLNSFYADQEQKPVKTPRSNP